MKNYQGLHTILVSKEYHATYSGMTPGFFFNKFSQQEIDIDLQRLCFNAGATFIKDEVIIGATSTARATISNYKPNPVNNIQDLLNFRDPDKAISNFLTKFRNEFLNTLPETLDGSVDKRKLIKNIKSYLNDKKKNYLLIEGPSWIFYSFLVLSLIHI